MGFFLWRTCRLDLRPTHIYTNATGFVFVFFCRFCNCIDFHTDCLNLSAQKWRSVSANRIKQIIRHQNGQTSVCMCVCSSVGVFGCALDCTTNVYLRIFGLCIRYTHTNMANVWTTHTGTHIQAWQQALREITHNNKMNNACVTTNLMKQ